MGSIKKIHLIAACGTGMGTLACILKEMGHMVTGSDQHVYPPMSDFLKEKGIHITEGFHAENISYGPDLVIVGNAVSKDNPEAVALLKSGIEYISMPQAVNRFIAQDKKLILVTGTHGKTTTSSIMAHILYMAGLDPSFMIGGILKGYDSSFRIGKGEFMVIEGDEYDTAFFDKGPKFMHYSPEIAIVTGIEFDHADIFKDIAQIKGVFKDFILKNKQSTHFVAYHNCQHLSQVLSDMDLSVETYGSNGEWSFSEPEQGYGLTRMTVSGPGHQLDIETPVIGYHNMNNTLACIAAAKKLGLPDDVIFRAMMSFSGVKRRQEVRGVKNGITVMDDFAHHPTAVKETLKAVKPHYREGRIIAVFEPRTNTSMRRFFQETYPESFLDADLVCICDPAVKKRIPRHEKFSTVQLVQDIEKKGVKAIHFKKSDDVIHELPPMLEPKDLVLIMSNGGFDNIHARLLENIL